MFTIDQVSIPYSRACGNIHSKDPEMFPGVVRNLPHVWPRLGRQKGNLRECLKITQAKRSFSPGSNQPSRGSCHSESKKGSRTRFKDKSELCWACQGLASQRNRLDQESPSDYFQGSLHLPLLQTCSQCTPRTKHLGV